MKFVFTSFLLSLLLVSHFTTSAESVPENFVSKSEQDSTLKLTESLFEIKFNTIRWMVRQGQQITISCNGVVFKYTLDSTRTFRIPVVPGKYKFEFFAGSEFFEIETDAIKIKPGFKSTMLVNFQSSVTPVLMKKPVIYVYPSKRTEVTIKLDLKGKMDFTYPSHGADGWSFVAHPDGRLIVNEKEHNYLFWEGSANFDFNKIDLQSGFLVQKEKLIPFFEAQLTKMGLNAQEQEDFITFWGPQMSRNEQCYVHFMFNEEYGQYAPLDINPKPDHIFRMYMLWSPIPSNTSINVQPQELESFKREGFSVVEWGGSEIKYRDQTMSNPITLK